MSKKWSKAQLASINEVIAKYPEAGKVNTTETETVYEQRFLCPKCGKRVYYNLPKSNPKCNPITEPELCTKCDPDFS